MHFTWSTVAGAILFMIGNPWLQPLAQSVACRVGPALQLLRR